MYYVYWREQGILKTENRKVQNYINYINDQTNVPVSGITPPAIFTINTFPLFFFFGGQSRILVLSSRTWAILPSSLIPFSCFV